MKTRVKPRKQVNIRLNAYIDDLLNAIVDGTGLNKTDVINAGIERVALDVLGVDLVNEIRLRQYSDSYVCKSCKKLVQADDVDEACLWAGYCWNCYEAL